MGGRLLEEQGHLAPDRFAEVTTGGCHTTGTPLCPVAMSNSEFKFALVPIARGSSRPHPRKGTRQRWVSMLSAPASSRVPVCLCRHYHSSCVFFSRVIYFSEGKECGEFTTGLAFIFFFFSAAQQPLLYEGSGRETDGRVEEAEGPG